jgi:O-antigen/teichoic acid export membrane protein
METIQERDSIISELGTALRHTVVYGLGNVMAKVLGFLMLPIYTRYLTPVDYGTLEILDLSMSLFGMFLQMGMIAAILRCYAAAKTPAEKKRVISTAMVFVLITGTLTFIAGVAFIGPASRLLLGSKVSPTYLLISFSAFICSYITTVPRTYLRAKEASGTFTLVSNISLGLLLGLNIYFVVFLKIGLVGILWSSLIVNGMNLLALSVWALRDAGVHFSTRWMRELFAFGGPLMFSNLAVFALNFSDRFFLQHLRNLEVVGIYAVGYKFGYMLNYLVVQPFYVMWQARMYAVHDQPNHEKIFSRIFVLYSLVLVYAGLGLAALSPEIIHLMVGPKFASSQGVVPVVILAYVFWGMGFYVQVGMFLTNRTGLIALVGAIAAVVDLVLNYVLILRFGMMGAAWATLLSFAVMAGASYWYSQQVFPLRLGVRRVCMMLSLAVGCYLLSRWATMQPLGTALVIKGGLLLGFPLVLWKFGILAPAEIDTIHTAWRRSLARVSRLAGSARGRAASA